MYSQDENFKKELEVDLLLETIYRLTGYDFKQYVRASIIRRIENRRNIENAPNITTLIERAFHEPGFLEKIIEGFSVPVTEMFRDPSFFKEFRTNIVPILRNYQEIRIWHAGCATGEEVFSMAILLEEEGLLDKARIYATDMSKVAIEQARQGIVPLNKMQNYTKNYLKAGGTKEFSMYYKTNSQNVFFAERLLKNVIFAQHNLVTDQSFNEFHVIFCRNVLIYFNPTLQNKVHELFIQSLSPNGFLGLGNKESLRISKYADSYEEFSTDEPLYRKK
ncbi:CheR family methyltransferase [Psychrobacillus sp. NPDC093180]|uniref:CheR family methyltransferase n=1 Tax=Psychrobacillus sp. NPDC093180 TaxID=3364489 RepID=UPI0037F2311B